MGKDRDERDTKPAADPAPELDDWESLFGEGDDYDEPAAGLPAPAPEEEEGPSTIKYLGFRLDDERYAVPILGLTEIVNMQEITAVPHVRPFVLGIISVRGRIVPIVDLKMRLFNTAVSEPRPAGEADQTEASRAAAGSWTGGPAAELSSAQGRRRLLIAKDEDQRMGLLVDSVTDVFLVEPREVEPPPPTLSRRLSEFVSGIARVSGYMHILLETRPLLRFDAVEPNPEGWR